MKLYLTVWSVRSKQVNLISYYQIDENALSLIQSECDSAFPNETGGILIGRFDSNSILIQYATDSGPMAKRSPGGFRRDGDYSQAILDRIFQESLGEFDYIGEWHSHPAMVGPSSRDRKAMRWIARNRKYDMSFPVLGISAWNPGTGWKLFLYQFAGRRLRSLKCVCDASR
ncbi:MAG: hypothetical protein GF311_27610 [Candidatus Lokiarchaeota archaeon]|nr:hypothetical protein [Candidatus Lokiarchaeota archaeon]